MKRLWLAFLFLFVGNAAFAQYSNVTASVVDSDNVSWNNGTYTLIFVPPVGYTGTVFTFNGSAWTPTSYSGVLNGSGNMAVTVERNDYILPAGSKWVAKICPKASYTCSNTNVTINTAAQNISSSLALNRPRFPASNVQTGSYGYADVEVSPTPAIGFFYFNVNTNTYRIWAGLSWIDGWTGAFQLGGDVQGAYNANVVRGINGLTVPISNILVGTNSLGQLVDASSALLPNSISGNAATATRFQLSPSQCTSNLFSQGVGVNGNANCASVTYSMLTGSVPTWNQSTTGNAATATRLLNVPSGCGAGQFATSINVDGSANCTSVTYALLTGTVPTWNQNTSGNAATATHASNLPTDFATQSAASPQPATFTNVNFSDGTQQTTARPTSMPHWTAALQNVLNGGNGTPIHARVLWIGDSTYLGVSATIATSVPANFCNDTIAYYGVRCEWNSWFGGSAGQSGTFGVSDPRIVMGSAWAVDSGIQSFGGDAYTATTATNSFAFTPTTAVDTFEVYYVQQPGNGVLSVQIDGGTATNINTAGTAALKKVTIPAGSLGTHTITHTWLSGGKVDLVGNVAYDSTGSSVIVLMAGWSGVTSGGLSGNTNAYNTGNSAAVAVLAPDLTVIEDGINDWASVGNLVSTFKTNMQSVITNTLAGGSDVALNSPIPSSTTCATQAFQSSFVEAYRNLAATNRNANSNVALPFIDTYTAWGTYVASQALFWRGGDCWHGSSLGYSALSVLIESAVLGAPAHPFAMNVKPFTAAVPAKVISKNAIQLVGGNYTITGNEGTIWAFSNATITFPAGLPWGFQVDIQGSATLVAGSGSGIFNTSTKVGGAVTLQTNSTYWYAIGSNGGNYVTGSDQFSNYTSSGGERMITLHSGAGVTLTAASSLAMLTVVNTSSSLSSAISFSGTSGFGVPSSLPPQSGITICYTNFWWICGTSSSLSQPPVRAGTWSISAATSVAVTFSTAMTSAPTSCSVMPSSSSATTGQPYPSTLSTTGFAVNVPTSGTISGTYQCVVNNAN